MADAYRATHERRSGGLVTGVHCMALVAKVSGGRLTAIRQKLAL